MSVVEGSDEQIRLEAGRLLRRWILGSWRAVTTVIPMASAIVGATLFYVARVSEKSFLNVFGLITGQVGASSPDIASIVFPGVLLGIWIAHLIYRSVTIRERRAPRLEWFFEKAFLRGDGRTIATILMMFISLGPVLSLFILVHFSAFYYGKMRAYSVVYRVINRACADDCVFYQKELYGAKKVPTGVLGIPIAGEDGRLAVFTNAGTVILKSDDVQKVERGRFNAGVKREVGIFSDVLYGSLLS